MVSNPSALMRRSFTGLVALLFLSSASWAMGQPHDLQRRIEAAVTAKPYGRDALEIIGNLVDDGGFGEPVGLMPIVRDALREPLAVPMLGPSRIASILQASGLSDAARQLDSDKPPASAQGGILDEWTTSYLTAVDHILNRLKGPAGNISLALADLLADVGGQGPGAELLEAIGGEATATIARNIAPEFVTRVTDFALRVSAHQFPSGPDQTAAIETPFGRVLIGTHGNDHHVVTDDVVLILDPGGDDRYDLSPATAGYQLTIIDLAGNDHYVGSGLAVLALSAIVDLAGNDRYEGEIGAQAATIGGVALLIDRAGNDHYSAASFAQAAAALGVAMLLDNAGDDRFELATKGQGLGWAGGIGILWDRAGNDLYQAGGPADTLGRDGAISLAQGMGMGLRGSHAGGLGLLIDDDGADIYRADMFAQGSGYYYGMGILADRAGNDRYEAARYAQGAGAHAAVGLLLDDGGDDIYQARVGVAQGMGLDKSVGVLLDRSGDDEYSAGSLAQGAGTFNGIGILIDKAGRDRFALGAQGWGQDHAARGLPGLAFLIGSDADDRFLLADAPLTPDETRPDGPGATWPLRHDRQGDYACPDIPAPMDDPDLTAVDTLTLLWGSAPMVVTGTESVLAYAELVRRLPQGFDVLLRAVPPHDVATGLALIEVIRCYLTGPGSGNHRAIWEATMAWLDAEWPLRQPWLAARLLGLARESTLPVRPAVDRLSAHPACSARAAAIGLAQAELSASPDPTLPDWLRPHLTAALTGSCFQAQSEAMRLLDSLPQNPETTAFGLPLDALPAFLADRTQRRTFWPP